MRTSETVIVPASPAEVFVHIASLESYPAWLPLVHEATSDAGSDPSAWFVEVRAQVGPFSRSKRLRMARTEVVDDRLAVFERAETDGRDHARWALTSELEPRSDGKTLVTMNLAYDGGLWTGAVLQKVLEEEVRRGQTGLLELFS